MGIALNAKTFLYEGTPKLLADCMTRLRSSATLVLLGGLRRGRRTCVHGQQSEQRQGSRVTADMQDLGGEAQDSPSEASSSYWVADHLHLIHNADLHIRPNSPTYITSLTCLRFG